MNPRQKTITEFLARHGEASVQDLAERLGVTPMTIRRDLDSLERSGQLIRTHGGAVLANAGIIEFSFKRKGQENLEEKQAIAEAVAGLVHPGMTVTLDTGTTALEVAQHLAGIQDLTVLTSSLVIASSLYARDGIELVLLGGKARRGSPDLTGWLTEENLKHFRVDLAVLGADGVDREGAYTVDEGVARVSQSVIACCATAVLAVDHTKFERPSFLRYAAWRDFDCVVTDSRIDRDTRKWLRRAVGNVVLAEV